MPHNKTFLIYLSNPFTSSSFIHQPSTPLLTRW
nr:MAG TPA: hypothetical protein [Caudoviricetes sp.]